MVKSPVPMYASIMTALGCEVDASDLVSFIMPSGDRSPLLVEGRRLVLPTPEMLKRIQGDQHIAYHPLCEMIMMNESQVQAKIRNVINIKTMFVISTLMLELISIAISPDKKITSKAPYFDLFTEMQEASPRTQKSVKSLVDAFKPSGLERRLVNFQSKRTGKINDKNFRRITSVVFPILAEFDEKKPADRIFDVKMSKKDKEVIFRLLKYIVPSIMVPDHYSAGSESMIAPSFDSLMKSYALLMADLNKISWKFKDDLANVSFLNVDLSFLDMTKDLEQYKGFLPPLDGNQGEQNLNAQASSQNAISIDGMTPAKLGIENVPVVSGTLTSPSVTNTVKTPEQIAKATAASTNGVGLAIPPMGGGMGMMGGMMAGAALGGMAMGNLGMGMPMNGFNPMMGGMMGGNFGGFPTVAGGQPNAGFIHPNGTQGINPMLANGMMGGMPGMPGMNMGGMGMPNMGFNGFMPGQMGMMGMGQVLPAGCVMGRTKVVNLMTDSLDELERELPPDVYSQIYTQRAAMGQQSVQQAMWSQMMGGGFKAA